MLIQITSYGCLYHLYTFEPLRLPKNGICSQFLWLFSIRLGYTCFCSLLSISLFYLIIYFQTPHQIKRYRKHSPHITAQPVSRHFKMSSEEKMTAVLYGHQFPNINMTHSIEVKGIASDRTGEIVRMRRIGNPSDDGKQI